MFLDLATLPEGGVTTHQGEQDMAKVDTSKASSKSALIREALTASPDMGPTDMAKMLTEMHGREFSPAEVSQQKVKMKKKEGGEDGKPARKARAIPAKPDGTQVNLDDVLAFQELASRLGKDAAQKVIDKL